jgi:hypothetical protein
MSSTKISRKIQSSSGKNIRDPAGTTRFCDSFWLMALTLRIEQMTIALLALKWRANDDVSVRRSAIS